MTNFAMLTALPHAAVVVDSDARVVFLNPSAAGLLNLTGQTVSGQPADQLLPDAIWAAVAACIDRHRTDPTYRQDSGIPVSAGLSSASSDLTDLELGFGVETTGDQPVYLLTLLPAAPDSTTILQQAHQFVLDHVPAAVFWKDSDLVYQSGNRLFLEWAGLDSLETVTGRTDFDLPWPRDVAEAFRALDRHVLETGEAIIDKIETLHEVDGRQGWVKTTKLPLRNAADEIIGVLGVSEDITELIDLQYRLHDEMERLTFALDGAALGLWDWYIQTGVVTFNERWASMLGYTLDELEPNVSTWEKLLHPDDAAEVTAVLNAHLRGETEIYVTEHRLRTKAGGWKWILDRGKVFAWDAEGNPLRAAGTHLDIDERKHIEHALRESEQRFRSVVASMNDIVYTLDREQRFTGVYGRWVEHFDLTPEHFFGRKLGEIATESVDTHVQNHERVLVEGRTIVYEWEIAGVGSPSYYQTALSPLRDRQGAIIGLVGVGRDVTALTLAQQAAQEQRAIAETVQRITIALNQTLDYDVVLDTILQYVSEVIPCDAVGILFFEGDALTIVRQRGFEERGMLDDDVAGIRLLLEETPTVRKMVETRQPALLQDMNYYDAVSHSNGLRWLRSYAMAPLIIEDQVVGVLGLGSEQPDAFYDDQLPVLEGFTSQAAQAIHKAQLYRRVRADNDKLRILNTITRVGTAVVSTDELLQQIADTAAEIIGADATYITLWEAGEERVLPVAASGPLRESYRSMTPQSGERTLTESVLKVGHPLAVSDVYDTPHLSPRIAAMFPARSLLALPLQTADAGIGSLIIAFDTPHDFTPEEIDWASQATELITLAIVKGQAYAMLESEVEARTAELKLAYRDLRELDELKDAFLAGVSHELRTPITNFKLYHRLLSKRPERSADYLEVLRQETERLEYIVEELIYVSKLDNEQMPPALAKLDLGPLLDSVLDAYRQQVDQGRRELVLSVTPEPLLVLANRHLMQRVIRALMDNACKYTQAGDQITVRAWQTNGTVCFSVEDTGPGIPPADQPRVFDRFYRGQITLDSGIPGAGLGLFIARQIVQQHRGTLTLTSSAASPGTMFTVELPRAE
jgi:PAS domain S-box-containing protein